MTSGFHLQPGDLRLVFVLDNVSVVKLHHIDGKSEQCEAHISLKSVKHFNLGASTDLTIRKLITRQLKTSSSYII